MNAVTSPSTSLRKFEKKKKKKRIFELLQLEYQYRSKRMAGLGEEKKKLIICNKVRSHQLRKKNQENDSLVVEM